MIGTNRYLPNILHIDRIMQIPGKLLHQVVELPVTLLKVAYAWQGRITRRRHIKELSDHLLRDAGLDREAARHEYSKPFWLP